MAFTKLLFAVSLLITWNIGQVVSTSDNDQVKAGEKYFVNVKPV